MHKLLFIVYFVFIFTRKKTKKILMGKGKDEFTKIKLIYIMFFINSKVKSIYKQNMRLTI